MALGATHIRFALDLKKNYQVQDLEKYISGTIYPDSRYVTHIDRNLTHGSNVLLPEFAVDDFRKGWQVHKICDAISYKKWKELFPELIPQKIEDEWVLASATKIIQSMNDLKCFDLQSNLKYLKFAFNPNGEDIDEIKKYNQIMIDLYQGKTETSVEDNYQMWLALGISKEDANLIKIKTEEYLKDADLVKRIESVYDEMVRCYKEVFPQ